MHNLSMHVYLSSICPGVSRDVLPNIAESSQRNNAELEITGLLLYSGDHFVQLIEGPREHLTSVYDRICADPRHTAVRRLINSDCTRRLFGQWSMGVLDVSESKRINREEFYKLAARTSTHPEQAGKTAIKLLKLFRQELGGDPVSIAA